MKEHRIQTLKKRILKMACKAQEGHIASAFSILDILWVLYDKILYNDRGEKQGNFILSKGHASLGLYVVLQEKGFLREEDLEHFAEYDSILGGHPSRNKIREVTASTGSLGHGLPIAVGLALGDRIQASPLHTYVLVGDGEMNEGSMWEAAALAGHHALSNLTCIIDYNHSTDRALDMGDFAQKLSDFGWDAVTVNGHDHAALFDALSPDRLGTKPRAVIAQTIKGYGCKEMENNPAWHHRFPTEEETRRMLRELDEMEA